MPTTWPSTREPAHDVHRPERVHLEELAVVDDLGDHLLHVVRLVRRVGDEPDDPVARAVGVVVGLEVRRVFEVVGRQEREQVAHLRERGLLVVAHERRDTRLRRVRQRAAELLLRDVLAGDRLHDVGAGDEHVRRALDHHHEVGERGRVHRAAGAGPEDHADLGDDARGLHVAREDPAVRVEGDDTFLDARAGAVVEADERRADRLREVHHLVDLLGEHLAERAAEHGEVLAEHEHLATVDRSPTGDDAVGEGPGVLDPEAVGPVAGEHVELDERARVEQQLDALAGGELAALVLALDRGRAPRVEGLLAQLGELDEAFLDRMRSDRVDRAFVTVQRLGFGGALEVFFFSCRHRVRGYRCSLRRAAAPPERDGGAAGAGCLLW